MSEVVEDNVEQEQVTVNPIGDNYMLFKRKDIEKCICGSENVILVRSNTDDNYVKCIDCGREGPKYHCSPIIVTRNDVVPKSRKEFKLDNDSAVKQAIKAWNKANK